MRQKEVQTFMRAFNKAIAEHPSHEEAYEQMEITWVEEYGRRAYKNYDSFKAAKYYYTRYSRRLVTR